MVSGVMLRVLDAERRLDASREEELKRRDVDVVDVMRGVDDVGVGLPGSCEPAALVFEALFFLMLSVSRLSRAPLMLRFRVGEYGKSRVFFAEGD